MNKTRIVSVEAVVLTEDKPTGVGRAVKGYVSSLIQSDSVSCYHIFLVSPKENLSFGGDVVVHYFSDLLPLRFCNKKFFKILYKLKFIYIWFIIPFILKKIRSDIYIGTHGFLFPLNISRLARSIYVVYDFVGFLFPGTMTKKNRLIVKFITRRNIRNANEIITISDSVSSELKQLIDKDKICHTVHLGFDQNIFYPLKQNDPCIKKTLKKYNISKPYVLSVATIEPRKNLEMVCRGFEKFNTEHKYQLVLAGKIGWNTSPILESIKKSSMAGDIIVTGFVDDRDLSPLFSGAELFIFLPLYEGFGLPVLEAMACGCPVLVSNIPPLKEVTADSGVIVDPGSIDQISSSLKKITGDRKLKIELKKKSLARSKLFTWNSAGEKLKKVIAG